MNEECYRGWTIHITSINQLRQWRSSDSEDGHSQRVGACGEEGWRQQFRIPPPSTQYTYSIEVGSRGAESDGTGVSLP
ncbi:hypothetical protein BDV33DRAFT_185484 [Aspergillus novoparasiticus]|uniref:Uncharacterized protein n=1 Tax=Aspergillus novoparasiticus TaxID=986946 RepID=A0A5N6E8F0_9EURO|nr:hypothetical protein BDV33DRAFT_185484 [Aspergillus novoparasiticus]